MDLQTKLKAYERFTKRLYIVMNERKDALMKYTSNVVEHECMTCRAKIDVHFTNPNNIRRRDMFCDKHKEDADMGGVAKKIIEKYRLTFVYSIVKRTQNNILKL